MRVRPSDHSDQRIRRQQRVSVTVALAMTIASLALHLLRFQSAGALWRDEASGAALAALPSVRELWRLLMHDSFPAMFSLTLRGWALLGLSGPDSGFRTFGFVVGIAMVSAFWIAARAVGKVPPLLSLALVSVCGAVVCDGDAIRGYGPGSVLIILSFALLWRYIEQPGVWRLIAAMLAATASVQLLFQNALLVLAIFVAGALAVARARGFWEGLRIVGFGIPPALTLLPYVVGLEKAQSWWIIEKVGFSLQRVWANVSAEVGSEYSFLIWIWVLLVGIGVGGAMFSLLWRSHISHQKDAPSAGLFAGSALVLGSVGFLAFLRIARLPTQPWYYVPLIALVACCLDVLVPRATKHAICGTTALAAGLAIAVVPKAVGDVQYRQTDVDVIAKILGVRAGVRDLIVIQPWYCGVTFDRYYRGTAPWVTLPPLEDCRMHRYDLLKEQLAAAHPTGMVLQRMAMTLSSGHTLWVVGRLDIPPGPDARIPYLPPAPNSRWGWSDVPYIEVWSEKMGKVVARNATSIERVEVPEPLRVNPYEDLPLYRVRGSP